jgi:hypothetical protein
MNSEASLGLDYRCVNRRGNGYLLVLFCKVCSKICHVENISSAFSSFLNKSLHTSCFSKSDCIHLRMYEHILNRTNDEMLPRKDSQAI